MFIKQVAVLLAVMVMLCMSGSASADILYESGTLGPTGIPYPDDFDLRTELNIHQSGFTGVRFHLTQSVITSQIGGHFVGGSNGTFFGAIVKLDSETDFPNSSNLSTPDVLGAASLSFPVPSAEVFGNLKIHLTPGWYALVFGSGLFGTSGYGAALWNNSGIGDPSYIISRPISGGPTQRWFNSEIIRTPPIEDFRFVVTGTIVPEPGSLSLLLFALWPRRAVRWHSIP
jgi:hypothetical protein